MTDEIKKKASKEISKLVSEAYEKLAEAQALADEHGLCFTFEPAYGMGGWYTGKGRCFGDNEFGYWIASSQSC